MPGAVIRRFCHFTRPPKIKLLLVARVAAETTVFVVNSEMTDFVRARQHLADCHVPIDLASHAFLDHDSFIDCTEPADYVDTAALVLQLTDDLDKLRGNVSPAVRARVVQAISDSFTMPEAEKPALIAALT